MTQSRWVHAAARAGYFMQGVSYVALGMLATLAAFGVRGGKTTNQVGLLQEIATHPFGAVLLVAIGIGMLCFAVWNMVEVAADPEGRDTRGLARILRRIGFGFAAATHASLAVFALRALLGSGDSGASSKLTADVLEQPGGKFMVMLTGLGMIGYAVAQVVFAVSQRYFKDVAFEEMPAALRASAGKLAVFGIIAHAIIFAMIGVFLVRAGFFERAGEARGVAGAFKDIARYSGVPYVLVAMALGLIAFGIFGLLSARYRKLEGSGNADSATGT